MQRDTRNIITRTITAAPPPSYDIDSASVFSKIYQCEHLGSARPNPSLKFFLFTFTVRDRTASRQVEGIYWFYYEFRLVSVWKFSFSWSLLTIMSTATQCQKGGFVPVIPSCLLARGSPYPFRLSPTCVKTDYLEMVHRFLCT